MSPESQPQPTKIHIYSPYTCPIPHNEHFQNFTADLQKKFLNKVIAAHYLLQHTYLDQGEVFAAQTPEMTDKALLR